MTSIYLILCVGFAVQAILAYYTATRCFKDAWWRRTLRDFELEIQRSDHKLELAEEELYQVRRDLTQARCDDLARAAQTEAELRSDLASALATAAECRPFSSHIEEAAGHLIAVADGTGQSLVDVIAQMERFIVTDTKVGDAAKVIIPEGRRAYTLDGSRIFEAGPGLRASFEQAIRSRSA